MKTSGSIYRRLVSGSLLWTIVFVVISNVLITGLAFHSVSGARIHVIAMTLMAGALLLAGIAQIRSLMSPFNRLKDDLAAIRDGRAQKLQGEYPDEVHALVSDLNALLEHRAQLVQRAQAKAGDLAHGLKTPLAVLGHEADRLTRSSQFEPAAVIGQQVEKMRRQIDYHLAHARAAASGATLGAHSSVLESVEGLARTMARIHAEKGVILSIDVSPAHAVRVAREDLDEMLGNLLDNAHKWAKSRVAASSSVKGAVVTIAIDDDGPGVPGDLREKVLQRGVRADEGPPGSGFGLAIVRDVAELHDGGIGLESSPLGGTRARLQLPAAAEPPPSAS